MGTVFTEEQSVFFVGGRGDKSGRIADAGGCTKAWWDAECPNDTDAEKAAAMAKLMTATGGPIFTQNAVPYTVADDRITAGGAAFAAIEVGMVVYVIENPIPGVDVPTGRFKITDVDVGGNWIECATIGGTGDTNVDIEIGGAFDELDNAVDDTSATTYSVWLHTNLAETLAAAVTITSGGNNARNTFKRISGYNTVPGDMSRGGSYYESPFQMLLAGAIDTDKTVRLDANGGAFENFSISGDNLIIENIYLYNNDDTKAGVIFVGVPQNIVFRNCRFSDMKHVYITEANSVLLDSCFAKDLAWNGIATVGADNVLFASVWDTIVGAANWITVNNGTGTQVIGCIGLGGVTGIRVINTTVVALGNTLYGQTVHGISLEGGVSAQAFDNIFAMNPAAAAALRVNGAGSIINDYNCFIETDGTPLTVGLHSSGFETPVIGPHSIAVDPLFVDEDAKNFRLLSGSPCRRTGKPTIGAT